MTERRMSDVRGHGENPTDLIWDNEHAHPSSKNAQGVDCVEGLASAIYLVPMSALRNRNAFRAITCAKPSILP
jgi:hypothetical protein